MSYAACRQVWSNQVDPLTPHLSNFAKFDIVGSCIIMHGSESIPNIRAINEDCRCINFRLSFLSLPRC